MTPERQEEIRQLLTYEPNSIAHYGSNGIYQFASDVRTGAMQLFGELNALTAEIATLRTKLDALVAAGEAVVTVHDQFYCDTDDNGNELFPNISLADVEVKVRALSAAVEQAKGEK